MKKAFAFAAAVMSAGYLLTLGLIPDPLPVVDEATALLILVKSLGVFGIDISRFVPFLGRRKRRAATGSDASTIDV